MESFIRAGVQRGAGPAKVPAPQGVEAFTAYEIAGNKVLVSEMEDAARQVVSQTSDPI